MVDRFNKVQKALELNQALALNETHVVLFGKNRNSSTINDDSDIKEDQTLNATTDATLKRNALFEETSFEENISTEISVTFLDETLHRCTTEEAQKRRRKRAKRNKNNMTNTQRPRSKERKVDIDNNENKAKPVCDAANSYPDNMQQKVFHHSMVLPGMLDKSSVGTPIRTRRNPRRKSTAN